MFKKQLYAFENNHGNLKKFFLISIKYHIRHYSTTHHLLIVMHFSAILYNAILKTVITCNLKWLRQTKNTTINDFWTDYFWCCIYQESAKKRLINIQECTRSTCNYSKDCQNNIFIYTWLFIQTVGICMLSMNKAIKI